MNSVTDLIRQWMVDHPEQRLPSIKEWAQKYGISYRKAWQAIQVLKDEGWLDSQKGKALSRGPEAISQKPEKLAHSPQHATPKITSKDWFHQKMIRDLEDGVFKSGTFLPKKDFFARTYRISPNTVKTEFQLLEQKGYLTKTGRRWLVGNKNIPRYQKRPVILLLQKNPNGWQSISSSERTSRFAQSMEQESDEHGIQLLPVFPEVPYKGLYPHVGGKTEICKLIESLGANYRGTLIVEPEGRINGIKEWAAWLKQFRAPVAWFDRHNNPNVLDSVKGIYRFHFSEANAMRKCREYVLSKGYPSVVYASAYTDLWAMNRGELLKGLFNEKGVRLKTLPPMRQLFTNPQKNFLEETTLEFERLLHEKSTMGGIFRDFLKSAETHRELLEKKYGVKFTQNPARNMTEIIRFLATGGLHSIPIKSGKWETLIWLTPYMNRLFKQFNPRMIICANDAQAANICEWMLTCNVSIPDDVEVLGFDNSSRFRNIPMSTVDFGFRGLGYKAFHLFSGMIPVHNKGRFNIAAQAKIISHSFWNF